MTFEQWKAEVDQLLIAEFGMDSNSMDDYCWYDEYKLNQATPEEAIDGFRDEFGF